MKKELMKNKEGEVYKDKEGDKLYKYSLEEGDIFIPQADNPTVKKGKYTNYGIFVETKEGEKVWLTLTQSQAEKLEDAKDPQTHPWKAYKYKNEFGDFIGISQADKKKPLSFEDIDPDEL